MSIRLSEEDFGQLVDQALADLPEQFLPYMENVSVEVQPRPTRELMQSMNIRGGRTLLGVYHGVPLTRKSVEALVDWPERIVIFQRNIEAICATKDQIVQQIRTTVLHEVGHHFGMDEDDLEGLGYG